jgi:hypothetical protein
VVRLVKFALPLAAIFCFGTLGMTADAAPKKSSSIKRSASASGAKKKSSASKKTSKSKSSAKSSKAKGKQRSAKGKDKSERTTAQVSPANDWIEELPPVELPEASGPPEDELLEPVTEPELEPIRNSTAAART